MSRDERAAPDAIRIVDAQEADVPAILDLLYQLLDVVEDTDGMDRAKVSENAGLLMSDPDSHILVAKSGDAVVGLINFTMRRTALHEGPSGLIDELVVAREHRGRGIGKMLVSAAAERCRELGCCEVEVSTEKSNTRAREFYRECGFDQDAVLLELDLPGTERPSPSV
jgi:ribosomal protein S18 acetylase RimI-like enzyme